METDPPKAQADIENVNMPSAVPFEREDSPLFEPEEMDTEPNSISEGSPREQPQTKRKIFDEESSDDDDNNEDVEMGDEDDEPARGPPYDATIEEMPQCPVYHPKHSIAQDLISKVFGLIHEPLDASSYTDAHVSALKDESTKRGKARPLKETRVALIGDMGTGKSSMLNSILGVGVLARKGDMGTSCTWVVQEFRRTLPRQTQPYGAEIEYYAAHERKDILAALFRDARVHSATIAKTEDLSEFQEVDLSQDQESKMTSHSALQALHALCRNRDDCATEEDMAELISGFSSDTDEGFINQLVKHTDKTLGKSIRESGRLFVQADTPEDLVAMLRKYTANAADADEEGEEDPSHWPMIKTIRFGLSNILTEQGIVLLDAPGVRDINRIRRKTVNDAILTCNHYLVLANITRGQADDTLFKYLLQGFNRLGSGRAVAILTHTDRIEKTSAIPKSGRKKDAYWKIDADIGALETREKRLTAKMRKVKGSEQSSTYQELCDTQTKVATKRAEQESLRILERSTQVAINVKATYKRLTGDRVPLPVFAISNSNYEQYQIGIPVSGDRPSLSLLQTKIPALRRHLYTATAKGRFNSTEFHIERNIPSLLASVELWCAKAHMKRKKEIEEIVTLPEKLFPQELTDNTKSLKECVWTQILDPMKLSEGRYNERAARSCKVWNNQNKTSPYLNLLRAEGSRKKTARKEGVNWNGELVAILAPDLRKSFRTLSDNCAQQERPLIEKLEELFDDMKDVIQDDPQCKLMALTPLINKIEEEKKNMRAVVERIFKDLKKRIDVLKDQATTDCEDSIVEECMSGVYAAVLLIKGRGSGADRPEAMRKAVSTAGGLWSSVFDMIRARLLRILDESHGTLEKRVRYVFTQIHTGFKHICQDKPYEDVEEKKLRAKLAENLVEAKQTLCELKEALDECKQWS